MIKHFALFCLFLNTSFSLHCEPKLPSPRFSLPFEYSLFDHKRAFDQAVITSNGIQMREEFEFFYNRLSTWLSQKGYDTSQKQHILHTLQILGQVRTFLPDLVTGLYSFLTTLEKPYSDSVRFEKIEEIWKVMRVKLGTLVTPIITQEPGKPTETQNPYDKLTFYTATALPENIVKDAINDIESIQELLVRPFETLEGKITRPLKRIFTFQNAYKTLQLMKVIVPLAIITASYWYKPNVEEEEGKKKTNKKSRWEVIKSSSGKKITFKDVVGIDPILKQIKKIEDFLENPEKYEAFGTKFPRAYLLVGPPGVGKTLIAQALSNETDAAFFSIKGSEIHKKFVGVGADIIRDLFKEARKKKSAIIFIDELDAFTPSRESAEGRGGTEAATVQLMTELEGFDVNANDNLIVLSATNYLKKIDKAVISRFKLIDVPALTETTRKALLELFINETPEAKRPTDLDTTELAQKTEGFDGRELSKLVNDARLIAVERNAQKLKNEDFQAAFDIAKKAHDLASQSSKKVKHKNLQALDLLTQLLGATQEQQQEASTVEAES